jgi:hypothetical protein
MVVGSCPPPQHSTTSSSSLHNNCDIRLRPGVRDNCNHHEFSPRPFTITKLQRWNAMRELKRKGRALFQRVKPQRVPGRTIDSTKILFLILSTLVYFLFFAYNTLGFTGNLAFNMTPKDMKQGWSFSPLPPYSYQYDTSDCERASFDRVSLVRVSKSQRMRTSPRTCLPHTTKRPTKRPTNHHSARSSGISLSLSLYWACTFEIYPHGSKISLPFLLFWAWSLLLLSFLDIILLGTGFW